jgi:hypothetical protein
MSPGRGLEHRAVSAVSNPAAARNHRLPARRGRNPYLLDLEAFDVDYLEKNLRVKPRKGKLFNFTDLEGNADRLFVFHRDVEKARERLKKGDPAASQ